MSVFDTRSSGTGLLVRLGFSDPARTAAALEQAGLWCDGRPVDAPAGEVVAALADVADPDLALASLVRLLQRVPDPSGLREALSSSPPLRRRLAGVLGSSAALGDHLVAFPSDWEVLRGELDAVRPSVYGLQRTLLAAVEADGDVPPDGTGGARAGLTGVTAVAALRAAYRRCLLALAARDVTGAVTVEEVGGEMADLAGATLSAALAVARTTLSDGAAPCRLAVIGMGKAGGRELNYVSDVDVVFVAEPPEGAGPDGVDAALRTATRLAGETMRVCAAVAWPVDAGLRPEGGAGPLVRTLVSHEAYYRRWAHTWEFQALLKARPIAGDLALGQAYVDTVEPMVWRVGERKGFVEDVQAMRRRVEKTLPGDRASREVKLGPGGLRDVEFAVQLLQLVHGRTDTSVRSGTTLVALDQLAAGGYVGREDARHLSEAYRWLRTVEHRLQLHRLRRTHLLPAPDDEAALRRLARAVGYRGDVLRTFGRERAGYGHEVRRLHEKLFYRPLLTAVSRLPAEQARLAPEAARARLEALGFAEPAVALRHLEALTSGVSRRAVIQSTLLPAMLGWFADAADPDAGLRAFRSVSDALGGTPWYLRLLRDEGSAAERLAHLLASSRFVADLLARAPEAVRLLASDAELAPRPRATLESAFVSVARRRDDWEATVVAARGMRREELLRVACADLLGLLDHRQVGAALSDVAAAVLAAALETATRKVTAERRRPLPVRIAVLAMGRLGGREQGYGSDADVLFVHEADAGTPDAEAASIAHDVAHEVRRLLALPAPDPPLVVDADLRPEGKQGPLSRSLSSYAAYYDRWSSVWEAQALLRAAPLVGDAELAGRFLDAVAPVRWPQGGPPEASVREIRRIKARMEAERMPRGADPKLVLKMGPGGLADVEWVVQLLQLRHAHAVEALRTPSTLPALRAARDAGLLEPDDADVLETAWSLAARARDSLTLVRGKSAVSLPSSGRELDGVARSLGYPASSQGEFLDDYRRATRRARAVVERVFYG
ncbi:MAG: Glutamate-ammonia-ligase adenylyltransferase [uncultured Frankineae bacterium]|uniref:Bifunctional glutamine synthetase adenylyltransferase/adenylyl-removing enzyme n=1 Tax=uncultured Frankineae bacterium TaxID=437475 RepID=A0A6J4KN83_9ACTN|nr:MAG: Glutamate-ammonia-ligase adenylyltransferase [uncultured Frankineae bacterium]